MDCGLTGGSTSIIDLFYCGTSNAIGFDFTVASIISMIFIAILAYKLRIPFVFSLGFAFILTYSFYLMSNGSAPLLLYMMGLLGLAIGVKIVVGLLEVARTTA